MVIRHNTHIQFVRVLHFFHQLFEILLHLSYFVIYLTLFSCRDSVFFQIVFICVWIVSDVPPFPCKDHTHIVIASNFVYWIISFMLKFIYFNSKHCIAYDFSKVDTASVGTIASVPNCYGFIVDEFFIIFVYEISDM